MGARSDGDKPVRRIKLTIAYDGTHFCGWQIQKQDRTVQDVLQQALSRMHRRPVSVTGSGRTDSGVHALGQVAHFDTDIGSIPAGNFTPALNSVLPGDVRIRHAEEADAAFHARYDAVLREYRYYITCSRRNDPFVRPYTHTVARMPDIGTLNHYARQVVGIHDFTTFSAVGDQSESRVRRIYSASFLPSAVGGVEFRVSGTAFLWRMVRSLVGTMLEMESKGKPASAMQEALEAEDRNLAGITAPAKGLYLYRVSYRKD